MTNLPEKEKKIRKNLRIKEVREKDGIVKFYPQIKKFGIWWDFDNPDVFFLDLIFKDWTRSFRSLNAAKQFIDDYVNTCLRKRKVLYHNVNYLTH